MLGDNGDESAEQSDRPLAGEASTPDPSPQAKKDLPGAQGEAAPGIKDVVSVALRKPGSHRGVARRQLEHWLPR